VRSWFAAGVIVAGSLAAASPARRVPPNTVWVGSYRCSQGITAVRLTIDARPNGDATASFEFGPHPENPKVPRGEAQLKGRVELLARGQLQVKLEPDRWVSKPGETWQMVGLTATSDLEHRVLEGRIEDPRCGEINVRRED
jgi:hypothetical protein